MLPLHKWERCQRKARSSGNAGSCEAVPHRCPLWLATVHLAGLLFWPALGTS